MSTESFKIEIKDLHTHSDDFFTWVRNLSLIRVYSSLELLLLRVIRESAFPFLFDPINSKRDQQVTINSIRNFLASVNLKADTKNNRYLIEYLKYTSEPFSMFCKQQISINIATTWEKLFEFISILRNVIAHHGTVVTKETHNEIASKASPVYRMYFHFDMNSKNEYLLRPKL